MKTSTTFFGAALIACVASCGLVGCTSESTRIAIESERRASAVETAVFDRQHEALCVLLYRDLVSRLKQGGVALDGAQTAELNAAWNDRDLLEWWRIQHERAAALRRAGVDAKLYGEQATLDLLIKSAEAKVDRAQDAAATAIVGALAPRESKP